MSETILDEIARSTRERVERNKSLFSLEELKRIYDAGYDNLDRFGNGRFYNAIKKTGLSFICEIKKASPSKGVISKNFPYIEIAKEYEDAGADCISCLTEPDYFLGSDDIFVTVRERADAPMLRKDFVVDEYQIYQARLMGADAILLIAAITEPEDLKSYISTAKNIGLDVLVEAHNENEINSAIDAGADIIGVNNRNLKDFSVDISNALTLKEKVPEKILFVAESGISSAEDIKTLKNSGTDAVLMGEVLMRSKNIPETIREMRAV